MTALNKRGDRLCKSHRFIERLRCEYGEFLLRPRPLVLTQYKYNLNSQRVIIGRPSFRYSRRLFEKKKTESTVACTVASLWIVSGRKQRNTVCRCFNFFENNDIILFSARKLDTNVTYTWNARRNG